MLFTPENAIKVLDGSKTQTRRPVKEGERGYKFLADTYYQVMDGKGRLKWEVGKTYAIQPGRGKKAIGYKVLKSIRKERLQEISEADALEDGGWKYSNCPIHKSPIASFAMLWDSIYGPGMRWTDNPEVWVLEFEAVKR